MKQAITSGLDATTAANKLEVEALQAELAAEVARHLVTAEERDAQRAEHLLDLKDARAQTDNMKTWVAALFAHVCRLSGKVPDANAPAEIQAIATSFTAERDAARADAEHCRKGEVITEGIARLVDKQTEALTEKLKAARAEVTSRKVELDIAWSVKAALEAEVTDLRAQLAEARRLADVGWQGVERAEAAEAQLTEQRRSDPTRQWHSERDARIAAEAQLRAMREARDTELRGVAERVRDAICAKLDLRSARHVIETVDLDAVLATPPAGSGLVR